MWGWNLQFKFKLALKYAREIWPYLRNEKRFISSAGANILVLHRAFTHSFMKVTSSHSFALFRPLSWKKPLFRGVSRFRIFQKTVTICPWVSFTPPARCWIQSVRPLLVFESVDVLPPSVMVFLTCLIFVNATLFPDGYGRYENRKELQETFSQKRTLTTAFVAQCFLSWLDKLTSC